MRGTLPSLTHASHEVTLDYSLWKHFKNMKFHKIIKVSVLQNNSMEKDESLNTPRQTSKISARYFDFFTV
jgi:hypothetical protein